MSELKEVRALAYQFFRAIEKVDASLTVSMRACSAILCAKMIEGNFDKKDILNAISADMEDFRTFLKKDKRTDVANSADKNTN